MAEPPHCHCSSGSHSQPFQAFGSSRQRRPPRRGRRRPVTRFSAGHSPARRALVPASNSSPPAATSSTCETAMPTCRPPSRHTTTMICASGCLRPLPAPRPFLHRQELALEVQHRPIADVLDPRNLQLLDAQYIGERHRGLTSRHFDEQVFRGSSPRRSRSRALWLRRPAVLAAHRHCQPSSRSIRDPESAPGPRCPAPSLRNKARCSSAPRDSGFTTISSGSASPSTTSPNCRPSAFSTAMKLSRSAASPCSASGHEQPVEKHQRQQFAAQTIKRCALHPLDRGRGLFRRNMHQF